jgi:hypothetical protein
VSAPRPHLPKGQSPHTSQQGYRRLSQASFTIKNVYIKIIFYDFIGIKTNIIQVELKIKTFFVHLKISFLKNVFEVN